ncbi:uncharacterized protein [Pyrus communis]|uniref:uncharacterized protein n=1 Tax=Pyrus communis TaxID=23211 RepID=UPI0035C215C9
MDFELQGKPHSKGSAGSSGSHVMNIHDEPRHTSFLSLSNSVDYSSYYKLRPPEEPKYISKDIISSLQKQVDDNGKPRQDTKSTNSEKWILFFIANLGIETASAVFDQLSSLSHAHFALIGMLLAMLAVLICILELILKGKEERVELRAWGMIWWLYHPYPSTRLFGSFPDICGLGLSVSQCICSAVQYNYLHRHANNPIKLSIFPFIFLLFLAIRRCCK